MALPGVSDGAFLISDIGSGTEIHGFFLLVACTKEALKRHTFYIYTTYDLLGRGFVSACAFISLLCLSFISLQYFGLRAST
jgi:hypothetical protein